MSAALVTIGIAAYNSGEYLAQALASASAQSYQTIEILLYDDGSTDQTLTIASNHPDTRLRILEGGQNRGVSWARQQIKIQAKGDYLTWLDSDDRFLSQRVELLLEAAEQSGADLVCDNESFIDTTGQPLPGLKRVPDFLLDDPHCTRLFERNALIPHPLISRRCFSQVDFDLNLTTSEDYDYWLQCSLQGFVFQRLDQALLEYRITPGSLSADPKKSRQAVKKILAKYPLETLIQLYRQRGYNQQQINYMACLQLLFREQYPQARQYAQAGWDDDSLADPAFYRAALALKDNDLNDAERQLQQHLQGYPDSPAGLNNLGVLYQRQGRDCACYWQQALARFPHYQDALDNLAGQEAITLTQLTAARPR